MDCILWASRPEQRFNLPEYHQHDVLHFQFRTAPQTPVLFPMLSHSALYTPRHPALRSCPGALYTSVLTPPVARRGVFNPSRSNARDLEIGSHFPSQCSTHCRGNCGPRPSIATEVRPRMEASAPHDTSLLHIQDMPELLL